MPFAKEKATRLAFDGIETLKQQQQEPAPANGTRRRRVTFDFSTWWYMEEWQGYLGIHCQCELVKGIAISDNVDGSLAAV